MTEKSPKNKNESPPHFTVWWNLTANCPPRRNEFSNFREEVFVCYLKLTFLNARLGCSCASEGTLSYDEVGAGDVKCECPSSGDREGCICWCISILVYMRDAFSLRTLGSSRGLLCPYSSTTVCCKWWQRETSFKWVAKNQNQKLISGLQLFRHCSSVGGRSGQPDAETTCLCYGAGGNGVHSWLGNVTWNTSSTFSVSCTREHKNYGALNIPPLPQEAPITEQLWQFNRKLPLIFKPF